MWRSTVISICRSKSSLKSDLAMIGKRRVHHSPFSTTSSGRDTHAGGQQQQQKQQEVIFDSRHRPGVQLDPSLRQKLLLAEEKIGRSRPKCYQIPDDINKTLEHMFKKELEVTTNQVKQHLAAGIKLRQYLFSRQVPLESSVRTVRMEQARNMVEREYTSELQDEHTTPEREAQVLHEIETKAERLVERRTYNWKPVNFDPTACKAYLLAKAPFDYACTTRVMEEIREREPEFQPRTFFDYGSGVGSAIWAFQNVFGVSTEVFAVDTSPDMNDLARLILLGDKESHSLPAGHFFRMHLPASNDLTYDIASSCFTLLELPTAEARLTAVDNLWRKTSGFLILIEEGTNAGFQVLAEARDYLIQVSRMNFEDPKKQAEIRGHLFAPCPHTFLCPRYFQDSVPCSFDIRYKTFQINGIPNEIRSLAQDGRFSYLVFKKGEKSPLSSFPRLMSEPIKKKNHIICRMCTNRGKLEEFVATKNRDIEDSKLIYRYTKHIHCGDQFKVNLTDEQPTKEGRFVRKSRGKEAEDDKDNK